jgi:hypothetical protein
MANKAVTLQRLIRWYKQDSKKTEIDMNEVADWLLAKGYKAPRPKTPRELLAKELSKAARQEHRKDPITGRTYRVNHAVTTKQGTGQLTLWVDIDEAPRKHMHKSIVQRREQMVGDAVQLTLDANHWNGIHPKEEPIVVPLDFQPDVDWELHAPPDDGKKTG